MRQRTIFLVLATCFAVSAGLAAAPAPVRAAPADSLGAAPALPTPVEPPVRRFWLPRPAEGSMLDPDRRMHAAVSFNIALDLRLAGASPAASLLGAASVGALKELHDSVLRPAGPGQGASRLDLAADAVGLVVAAVVLHLVSR